MIGYKLNLQNATAYSHMRWDFHLARCRVDLGKAGRRKPPGFSSVPDLIAAIRESIDVNNDDPKPFVWTASRTWYCSDLSLTPVAGSCNRGENALHE